MSEKQWVCQLCSSRHPYKLDSIRLTKRYNGLPSSDQTLLEDHLYSWVDFLPNKIAIFQPRWRFLGGKLPLWASASGLICQCSSWIAGKKLSKRGSRHRVPGSETASRRQRSRLGHELKILRPSWQRQVTRRKKTTRPIEPLDQILDHLGVYMIYVAIIIIKHVDYSSSSS